MSDLIAKAERAHPPFKAGLAVAVWFLMRLPTSFGIEHQARLAVIALVPRLRCLAEIRTKAPQLMSVVWMQQLDAEANILSTALDRYHQANADNPQAPVFFAEKVGEIAVN